MGDVLNTVNIIGHITNKKINHLNNITPLLQVCIVLDAVTCLWKTKGKGEIISPDNIFKGSRFQRVMCQ